MAGQIEDPDTVRAPRPIWFYILVLLRENRTSARPGQSVPGWLARAAHNQHYRLNTCDRTLPAIVKLYCRSGIQTALLRAARSDRESRIPAGLELEAGAPGRGRTGGALATRSFPAGQRSANDSGAGEIMLPDKPEVRFRFRIYRSASDIFFPAACRSRQFSRALWPKAAADTLPRLRAVQWPMPACSSRTPPTSSASAVAEAHWRPATAEASYLDYRNPSNSTGSSGVAEAIPRPC